MPIWTMDASSMDLYQCAMRTPGFRTNIWSLAGLDEELEETADETYRE